PRVRRVRAAHPRPLQCARRARMTQLASRKAILRILLVVATLALWEGIVRGFAVRAFIVPPPSGMFVALWRGFASGIYEEHLWVTLSETMLGFLFGCALAFSLGIGVALSRRVEYYLYPF